MTDANQNNLYAVHIDNLSVYYGRTPAVTDVCLDIHDGEYLGIIGPNGGGKSTLLKAILGLVPISAGTIQVYGHNTKNKALVGYVPQFAALNTKFPISLFEVVLTGCLKKGLSLFHIFSEKDKKTAYALLEKVGLENLADRQISELSGGEFQKMLIARALAVNPKLLLLDEPTASVDASSRTQIYNLLSDLNKDMTIVIVTHDLAVSSRVHSLVCLNGSVVYHGKPEFTEHIINSFYGCPIDLIDNGASNWEIREHKEENKID
ncbi:MAG: metal ABC transporter ATP-binding protein [Eubacteriales bacterium]